MILIIAYGNNLREDDGAGHLLAERLATMWQDRGLPVRLLAVQQLAPELAADIAGDDVSAVVFVDARPSTSPDDVRLCVVPIEPGGEQSPSVGHQFMPGVLLTYAKAICTTETLPPSWLVTVPGATFGYGERLSEVAQASIREAFQDDCSQLLRFAANLSLAV